MPWWSVIYLFLFVSVIAVSIYDDAREGGEKAVFTFLDAVSAVVCAYLFVSYWVAGWRELLGAVAPFLYVVAIGWQLWDTPRGLRKAFAYKIVPKPIMFVILAAVGLFVVPAAIIAGIAAFR